MTIVLRDERGVLERLHGIKDRFIALSTSEQARKLEGGLDEHWARRSRNLQSVSCPSPVKSRRRSGSAKEKEEEGTERVSGSGKSQSPTDDVPVHKSAPIAPQIRWPTHNALVPM